MNLDRLGIALRGPALHHLDFIAISDIGQVSCTQQLRIANRDSCTQQLRIANRDSCTQQLRIAISDIGQVSCTYSSRNSSTCSVAIPRSEQPSAIVAILGNANYSGLGIIAVCKKPLFSGSYYFLSHPSLSHVSPPFKKVVCGDVYGWTILFLSLSNFEVTC